MITLKPLKDSPTVSYDVVNPCSFDNNRVEHTLPMMLFRIRELKKATCAKIASKRKTSGTIAPLYSALWLIYRFNSIFYSKYFIFIQNKKLEHFSIVTLQSYYKKNVFTFFLLNTQFLYSTFTILQYISHFV